MSQSSWIPFGCSVKGASHRRKEQEYKDAFCPQKENQDAFYYVPREVNGNEDKVTPSIIAVSDGHGGDKYIRSKTGSKMAAEQIVSVWENGSIQLSPKMRADDLAGAIRHIKTRFLLLWQEAIDNHVGSMPFTEDELTFLKEHCSQRTYDAVLSNPRLTYGCTFLCAIAYDDLVLLLQLGDGNILGLYPNDEVKELMDPDPRNFGNETLSLCSLRDVSDIAHKVLVGNRIPMLITITTDGVKNSFDDQTTDIDAFYKIPIATKNELLSSNGDIDVVKTVITDKLLEKAAIDGAGDDVTIGVLFRDITEVQRDEQKDESEN